MSLVRINNFQPILHMYKIIVHFYSIDESINQFSIGYMINPSFNCNKVFREKVEKFWSVSFHKNTMETIKYFLGKKNKFVMALIIFYENNGEKPKQTYKLLCCVVYYLIDNYFLINYLSCQSKTFSFVSSKL